MDDATGQRLVTSIGNFDTRINNLSQNMNAPKLPYNANVISTLSGGIDEDISEYLSQFDHMMWRYDMSDARKLQILPTYLTDFALGRLQ